MSQCHLIQTVILAFHILQSPLHLENVCRSVTPNPTGSSLYPDNVRHFIPPNSTNSTLYPGNVSRPFIPTPNSQLQFYVFALCFSSYISPPPPPLPNLQLYAFNLTTSVILSSKSYRFMHHPDSVWLIDCLRTKGWLAKLLIGPPLPPPPRSSV